MRAIATATVTFAGRDEIAGRLRDNVRAAARAALDGHPEPVIRDLLLDGPDRRSPFSQVLDTTDGGTDDLLRSAARAVRRLAEQAEAADLEEHVRHSPMTARIVEALLTALQDRFLLLDAGELHRDPSSGWPESWTWTTYDHTDFHRALARFSSTSRARSGHLLTPLVRMIETSDKSRFRTHIR
ncbi:thioredoxin domain-containing protein [Actinomadura geliboluensis]|uniref:hypothetical protein n=1 Tax=Actinomadura geliboluensis TaxID=882440 RepID=UPI0036C9C822